MDGRLGALAQSAAAAIHPAPAMFTAEQLAADPILHFFHFAHLPAALRPASEPFCWLAASLVETLPRNAERSVALRKLLEAKDCAVRANVGSSVVASAEQRTTAVQDRLEKLAAFLNSARGHDLTDRPRQMLQQQRNIMLEYLAILGARIADIQPAAEQRTTAMQDETVKPMEYIADGYAVREVETADIDRDGPVKFGG